MEWSYEIQQKFKVAGLGILLILMSTALSLKKALRDMNQTVVSVNADRVQPAVHLVHLSENVHAKRLWGSYSLSGEKSCF